MNKYLIIVVISLTSCINLNRVDLNPLNCDLDAKTRVKDVLYFGENIPAGGQISDKEWQQFSDEVVSARFPEGFTTVDAQGYWRGKSGIVEHEESKVITLNHVDSEEVNKKIEEIISEYKERFHQEAVLHERSTVCTKL